MTGRENGIEVSRVAGVDADGLIVIVIDVQAAGLVEEAESEGGLFFVSGWQEEEQFGNPKLRITSPEVGKPDQSESKDGCGVLLLGR